jgi:hypothetical protein
MIAADIGSTIFTAESHGNTGLFHGVAALKGAKDRTHFHVFS